MWKRGGGLAAVQPHFRATPINQTLMRLRPASNCSPFTLKFETLKPNPKTQTARP